MRPLAAHCHLGLGKLYRSGGDHAKGREHLTTAVKLYRDMDMGFWLRKAQAELDPLLESNSECGSRPGSQTQ